MTTRLILFLLCFFPALIFSQGIQTEFGKNRVQYHDFDWYYYETENFITYWTQDSRPAGQYVVQVAEQDFEELNTILEHRMGEKISLIVYKDLTDLKQSNIGSEEAFYNTGGITKIVGNKIFVYFDGDHNDLRRQVREGIATVYLNHMMFGGNLQEIVQNAVLLNLPDWFTNGLISYIGEEWNTELDNRLRDAFLSGRITDFNELILEDPDFAGHSLWYFIGENYGKSTVANLLYLTRINRNVESGFLYVLGTTFRQTSLSWFAFFDQRYRTEYLSSEELIAKNKIEIKSKKDQEYSNFKLSPDGKKIAWVSNEIGRYKVHIQDLKSGDRKVVFSGGFRNKFQATDYNYPLIDWSPNANDLAIIYEKRDNIRLFVYNNRSKTGVTADIPNRYQRILSMSYMNPKQFVFSASSGTRSDIFIYNIATKGSTQITNDFYDDLDPAFVKINNQKGIVFSSNRREATLKTERFDSIMPLSNLDLWYYNLETKSKELVRISNTPFANEGKPVGIDSSYFAFVSDDSGINNRYTARIADVFAYNEKVYYLKDGQQVVINQDSSLNLPANEVDSTVLRPVFKPKAFVQNNSNYSSGILEQHTAPKVDKIAEVFFQDGDYQFYINPLDVTNNPSISTTTFQIQKSSNKEEEEINIKEKEKKRKRNKNPDKEPQEENSTNEIDTGTIDIDNYFFQSEFEETEDEVVEEDAAVIVTEEDGSITLQKPSRDPQSAPDPKIKFSSSRMLSYRPKFKTDYITTQLDNSLLFGGLEAYTGGPSNVSAGGVAVQESPYNYPSTKILLKGNIKDLFEDYHITGGIRIPTTFNGMEYFVHFDDLKKRLDKRYSVYHQSQLGFETFLVPNNTPTPDPVETDVRRRTSLAEVQLKYPLDIFRSVRLNSTLRSDKLVALAREQDHLSYPQFNSQRISLMAEYVFDNTLDVSLNIKNGTRYKFFAGYQHRFGINLLDGFQFNLNEGQTGIIGMDVRHYQRLDKHSIFAARFAGATSFGSEKILYYLGGVDNWLLPEFNDEIPIPQDGNFAYQTLASNMRGFRNNIRNGSSYALLNLELRAPVLNYLFRSPPKSSFLRNFQLVAFFDTGTAWQGLSPFDEDNPLNTKIIDNPLSPVSVKVNYFRNPIVAGYGVGARSVLFGYFIRMDFAWGLETGIIQDPIFYISLGRDF